ncbi:DNA gyrase subunit A [Methanospirillum sp.]|uniref:DNA gyrase subunit A n=1 Tax=Methanospirillum sp. TaxID=45200 RepID=UPI0035A1617A
MTSDENQQPLFTPKVNPVNIEEEMKSSYIDYAMSVIIGRAIPDARDGLKPVHRRSLYAMWEMGNTHDKAYKKSARVVGDVMGKYHPHGDASIYDTIVKMAQPFSYRMMLVDGQGNFGSVDGDAPAAMRYTEVRLKKEAEELLVDLEKETVEFTPNFDESLQEPSVLPAKLPNLLINGSDGIAVGIATKMAPHNLGEVCDAVCHYLQHPETTVYELMQIIPGPDFPTGGIIMGTGGIQNAYLSGQGKLTVRGVAEIDESGKRDQIIITEIPYQVNKAKLIEHIADLVRDKRIEGISDLRDESDKDGMRIVIDLRKDARPQLILNHLYKHTALESTFGVINYAIVDRQPKILGLIGLIEQFVRHRITVITRRSEFDKKKAENRVHILRGLLHAIDNIDAVIATIRAAQTVDEAKENLIVKFSLDEAQAGAILQMQLRRLAALEKQKLVDEREQLEAEIRKLIELLSSEANIRAEISRELLEVREKYADKRRTQITGDLQEIVREDLIPNKQVLVCLTHQNYVKHMDVDAYRVQGRGGRGVMGISIKDGDYVEQAFVANTHDHLLCFTSTGRAYWLRVFDIPEGSRQSKGKAIVNLLDLRSEERVTAVIPVQEFSSEQFFLFLTERGMIIKIPQDEFARPRSTGVNAISLREGDNLVHVMVSDGTQEIIITTKYAQSLRFHEEQIPLRHRNALGVIGMRMKDDDIVTSMTGIEEGKYLLTITSSGYGKRTNFDEYRGHGRGTRGVRNIRLKRNDGIVMAFTAGPEEEIILMSAEGIVIRTSVDKIPIQGRSTQGVRIMRLGAGDRVVGVTSLSPEEQNEMEDDIPQAEIIDEGPDEDISFEE